ncbi:MAG: DUF1080 domain-containing protein [Phycisphaerae bacterium]
MQDGNRHKAFRRALICLLVLAPCVVAGEANTLSKEEKEFGFRLLFDGRSMAQWRNIRSKAIRPQWQVADGAMVLTAKGGRDLITKDQFDCFDLRLEYTLAREGNSGILFRVVEDPNQRKPWRLAPEYQLYDSYNVKVRGDRCAGALYGLVAAAKDLAKKPGQWNQVRILLEPAGDGKERLRFWLNGEQTVDVVVDLAPDSRWSKLLAETKSQGHFAEAFFKAKRGHILLQDHGARVAFRNIRIRPLDRKIPAGTSRKSVPRPPQAPRP